MNFNIDFAKFDRSMQQKIISYSKDADLTLKEITVEVVKDINKNIVEEKNFTGEKARELKRKTVVRKIFKKRPYPTRIFYDSGLLARPSSIKYMGINARTNLVCVVDSRASILFHLAQKGRNPFGVTPYRFSQLFKTAVQNKFKK